MATSTLPSKPVENWEQVRAEWIASVEELVGQAEAWAGRQDWAVRREPKTLTEDRLGEYVVPRLLIHTSEGRLLLDPVARFVAGAIGLVDFCVLPSYDAVMIARGEGGWRLRSNGAADAEREWNEEAFLDTARQLLASP